MPGITRPHIIEVLGLVRRDGVSAYARGGEVSSPVLAIALLHDLNPVELQLAVRAFEDARTGRA